MTAPMTPERRAEIEACLKAEQDRLNALHNLHTGDLDIRLQTIVSAAQRCLTEIDRLEDLFRQIRGAGTWKCFHCGESFGNPKLAEAHFGSTPDVHPVCIAAAERGLVYELRAAQAEIDRLNAAVLAEREACAAICDALKAKHAALSDTADKRGWMNTASTERQYEYAFGHAATAIRARSEAKP